MSSPLPGLLLPWFARHRRDLAWRADGTSAWGVLVSEVMSQQTPVARVEPQWVDWMARWPTPRDLAAAPTAAVLRAWGKLGYPRRALRLKECATVIATQHDNVVPDDVAALLALPGVGDYTARAVAAFAYHQAVPVVDTNVRRVIARAVKGLPDAGAARTADLRDAEALLPKEDAAVFSAAIMELGALVCTARTPQCAQCPLLTVCAWQRAGCPPPTAAAAAAKAKRVQKFVGTDRQVRGLLLDVVRAAHHPVDKAALDAVWEDATQRDRALTSLLADSLMVRHADGRYSLPD